MPLPEVPSVDSVSIPRSGRGRRCDKTVAALGQNWYGCCEYVSASFAVTNSQGAGEHRRLRLQSGFHASQLNERKTGGWYRASKDHLVIRFRSPLLGLLYLLGLEKRPDG